MIIFAELAKTAKTKFDLTEPSHQTSLYMLTETLLDTNTSLESLKLFVKQESPPLEFKIAAKLVESKRILSANIKPLKLGIVFAMWGEQNRLYPKSVSNPHGEDALRVKLAQLTWATNNTSLEWMLYAVDDGCPYNSGKIAREIISTHPLSSKTTILFLANAIPTTTGPLAKLASVDKSRKGGAVILGCMQAIEDEVDVVIYTDADNSVHLGQIGLLLEPYLKNETPVVLGNRKHPEAVLVKQENRWGIGIKLLRHMQRMVGQAIFSRGILDTQAAFKLYQRSVLQEIIASPTVYDFSFDTDWIAATIALNKPFETVPFAFIDSFAESASITQGPMTTWEMLLNGLKNGVRNRNLPHNKAMARILDEEIHSSADLEILIHHLPPELEGATNEQLGNPAIMSPQAVQTWIQQRKREENQAGI